MPQESPQRWEPVMCTARSRNRNERCKARHVWIVRAVHILPLTTGAVSGRRCLGCPFRAVPDVLKVACTPESRPAEHFSRGSPRARPPGGSGLVSSFIVDVGRRQHRHFPLPWEWGRRRGRLRLLCVRLSSCGWYVHLRLDIRDRIRIQVERAGARRGACKPTDRGGGRVWL